MSNDELPIDLTTSFAQRAGGGLRLVLGMAHPPADARELRLTSRKRRVSVPVEVADGGDVMEAHLPAGDLPAGIWKLALVVGGEPVALEARLVVKPRQPVALLPGPRPTTRMAPPEPPSRETPARPLAPRRRIRQTAARSADAVLAVLPDERRTRVRSVLARVGRRVLP